MSGDASVEHEVAIWYTGCDNLLEEDGHKPVQGRGGIPGPWADSGLRLEEDGSSRQLLIRSNPAKLSTIKQ
jgi:hypothetical protein